MSHGANTLNDSPYLERDFYRHFVAEISDEIRCSTPPKTLAITGYWGSGKTSALAQLFHELTGKYPAAISDFAHSNTAPSATNSNDDELASAYTGVWFEAWRYQNEAQPIVSLLHAIKEEFTWLQKFKASSKKIVDLSVLGSLSILDSAISVANKVKPDLKGMPKMAEKYEKDNLLATLPTDKIHLALKEAIDALLRAQIEDSALQSDDFKPKLLIFIDDLDRCQPQAALKLLEGLKLYLNIPNCVIVMAIDQAQLEQAVGTELGEAPNKHFIGVEYLEKLCQDAHRLPLMTQKKGAALIESKLNKLLSKREEDADNTRLQELAGDIGTLVTETRCLPSNPRRIKMVINRLVRYVKHELSLQNALTPLTQDENEPASQSERTDTSPLTVKAMLFLACLYVSYRQVYEQLEWDIDFFDDLRRFANKDHTFEEEDLQGSPLEGLRQPSANAKYIGEPPSDLSILRPIKIIQNFDEQYDENFKMVLKQLIHTYNGEQGSAE